jgi:hypothetical protein
MAPTFQTTAETATQNRLSIFANAFKGYMGTMPVVAAALAPLLTFLKAIPMYESQKSILATLSGVLGFLLLAWLFYVRRTIALGSLIRGFRSLINMTPFLLIVGTLAAFIGYFQILGASTATSLELATKQHWTYLANNKALDFETGSDVLKHWDDRPISRSTALELLYLSIFLSAESAFVVMALREYINDTRQVSELEWMFGKQDAPALAEIQKRIQDRLQNDANQKQNTPPEQTAKAVEGCSGTK